MSLATRILQAPTSVMQNMLHQKSFESKDPRAPRTGKKDLYYKFYNDEGMKLVTKKYPQYLVFHEMLGLNLVGVKDDDIIGSQKT